MIFSKVLWHSESSFGGGSQLISASPHFNLTLLGTIWPFSMGSSKFSPSSYKNPNNNNSNSKTTQTFANCFWLWNFISSFPNYYLFRLSCFPRQEFASHLESQVQAVPAVHCHKHTHMYTQNWTQQKHTRCLFLFLPLEAVKSIATVKLIWVLQKSKHKSY